jgi:hypothetical protein
VLDHVLPEFYKFSLQCFLQEKRIEALFYTILFASNNTEQRTTKATYHIIKDTPLGKLILFNNCLTVTVAF